MTTENTAQNLVDNALSLDANIRKQAIESIVIRQNEDMWTIWRAQEDKAARDHHRRFDFSKTAHAITPTFQTMKSVISEKTPDNSWFEDVKSINTHLSLSLFSDLFLWAVETQNLQLATSLSKHLRDGGMINANTLHVAKGNMAEFLFSLIPQPDVLTKPFLIRASTTLFGSTQSLKVWAFLFLLVEPSQEKNKTLKAQLENAAKFAANAVGGNGTHKAQALWEFQDIFEHKSQSLHNAMMFRKRHKNPTALDLLRQDPHQTVLGVVDVHSRKRFVNTNNGTIIITTP